MQSQIPAEFTQAERTIQDVQYMIYMIRNVGCKIEDIQYMIHNIGCTTQDIQYMVYNIGCIIQDTEYER